MIYQNKEKHNKELYENLRIDCKKCFAFCCIALNFSTSEGFPTNKDAGKPCINLQNDFTCSIHKNLKDKGLKGCMAYDCFGAGQKVAQVTYGGRDWRKIGESKKQMFEVFLIVKQLHEMLWYLSEALIMKTNSTMKDKINHLIRETDHFTHLNGNALIELDVEGHRNNVKALLQQVSQLIREKTLRGKKNTLKSQKIIGGRLDFIGVDLRSTDLRGADLRGAFLIAANLKGVDLSHADLIGADLRDADLRGANLADSIFVTQSQINASKGDSNTKLPASLVRPIYWKK